MLALLVAIALAGAGAVVYAISAAQVEDAVDAQVEQELAEFRAFLSPATAEERAALPRSLAGKLETFISRNVPDDCEILAGWFRGSIQLTLPGADITDAEARAALQDPRVEAALSGVVTDGSAATLDTAEHGRLLLAAQPVSQGDAEGALVVVTFLDLENAELRDTMRTYALVAALLLVLITLLAGWQSGRMLAPLRVLRETTHEISETDLARRLPEVGNDDITALTRTLNGMLARLESAFAGQRRFLDDAGHELRTPLTVLQGHLELLDADDPDDVARTRALLLDEVDRMSRLVGDLILLAKHDRPDFLTPAPVSLERLTHTLHAKARALAEREWVLATAGEGVVELDEQRITQAVLQLADNAVKHTGDGDRIEIGSAVADGTVRLWVGDTGPGVPPGLEQHVFERFGRAEVLPDDEGFGLGLSIVRAIADAHGGRVTMGPHRPGAPRPGAVVTLHLPQEQPWPGS